MAFTFFFRDHHILETVVEKLAADLVGRAYPRIWDAGVAMGQEPYTLAIMLAERMGHFQFQNLRIDATDIDHSFGTATRAREAAYSDGELVRLPPGILDKYFEPAEQPGQYRVIGSIRSRVFFQQHDLLSYREIGQGYSLILCKNVLLHFTPEERVRVMSMFHRALAVGGLLVTEQTQEMPVQIRGLFEQINGSPIYRKEECLSCVY